MKTSDSWWNSAGLTHSGGHRGNKLADQLAKEAASSKTIEECYSRIPKSAVWSELNEQSVKQWQNERERSSKGVITNLSSQK